MDHILGQGPQKSSMLSAGTTIEPRGYRGTIFPESDERKVFVVFVFGWGPDVRNLWPRRSASYPPIPIAFAMPGILLTDGNTHQPDLPSFWWASDRDNNHCHCMNSGQAFWPKLVQNNKTVQKIAWQPWPAMGKHGQPCSAMASHGRTWSAMGSHG